MFGGQGLMDDFNENPNAFVFLLSTRAGGLGINLVSAGKKTHQILSFARGGWWWLSVQCVSALPHRRFLRQGTNRCFGDVIHARRQQKGRHGGKEGRREGCSGLVNAESEMAPAVG
jgi:hypothetical protein